MPAILALQGFPRPESSSVHPISSSENQKNLCGSTGRNEYSRLWKIPLNERSRKCKAEFGLHYSFLLLLKRLVCKLRLLLDTNLILLQNHRDCCDSFQLREAEDTTSDEPTREVECEGGRTGDPGMTSHLR